MSRAKLPPSHPGLAAQQRSPQEDRKPSPGPLAHLEAARAADLAPPEAGRAAEPAGSSRAEQQQQQQQQQGSPESLGDVQPLEHLSSVHAQRVGAPGMQELRPLQQQARPLKQELPGRAHFVLPGRESSNRVKERGVVRASSLFGGPGGCMWKPPIPWSSWVPLSWLLSRPGLHALSRRWTGDPSGLQIAESITPLCIRRCPCHVISCELAALRLLLLLQLLECHVKALVQDQARPSPQLASAPEQVYRQAAAEAQRPAPQRPHAGQKLQQEESYLHRPSPGLPASLLAQQQQVSRRCTSAG